MSGTKAYFDNNVYADLALRRINRADTALRKIKEAVSAKRVVVAPSFEIFEELFPVSQTDDRQFKRRWRLMHKLVDWSSPLKPANNLLMEDLTSYASTGKADSPYVTSKSWYYRAFVDLADMKEPPSANELLQLTEQICVSKGEFADVINQVGKDWYGKYRFPVDRTFDQYWSATISPGTDESTSCPKRLINALAESQGVGEACRARGLDKLLSLPTVLLPIGYWAQSWFDQVTKGRKEKPSVALDFRHCTLAAAVGTLVTGDAELRHAIQTIPGHNVQAMSLPELVATL